ncbi:MAG: hypothetical protein U0S12_13375 [Fimbriimonadales bacterium]
MKYVLITREPSIAEAARSPSAFPPDDQILVFEEWTEALEACDGADLIFVDMLATLEEPHKIAGYERFAEAKMGHDHARDVPLVLIAPPSGYDLDFMAGWPDFVFAHLPRPVTEKIFRRASTWV